MEIIEIFEEFVKVVLENNKYTVGLIDKDGRVVSCSNQDLIASKQSIEALRNREDTSLREIAIRDKSYGFLWVSGKESLKMISDLLFETLKTRIMYEQDENKLHLEVSKDDQIIQLLIREEGFDKSEMLELVNQLGINQGISRISILIKNSLGFNRKEIIRLKLKEDSGEMLYSLLDKNTLLIFKDIPNNIPHDMVKDYLSRFISGLRKWGLHNCTYCVGSMQNKLINYKFSYQNCLWLNDSRELKIDAPEFFNQNTTAYFESKIPMLEVRKYFDFYHERQNGIDIEELVEISEVLASNNYNITQAASEMYIHKNTLIYKLQKYENAYEIDIRGSFGGKMMFNLLSNYLKDYKKQKQVGEKL